jgi:hypothetical protein
VPLTVLGPPFSDYYILVHHLVTWTTGISLHMAMASGFSVSPSFKVVSFKSFLTRGDHSWQEECSEKCILLHTMLLRRPQRISSKNVIIILSAIAIEEEVFICSSFRRARWFILIPKITIWVIFWRALEWKCWYTYCMTIWYM